jgi:hypothetical protein
MAICTRLLASSFVRMDEACALRVATLMYRSVTIVAQPVGDDRDRCTRGAKGELAALDVLRRFVTRQGVCTDG